MVVRFLALLIVFFLSIFVYTMMGGAIVQLLNARGIIDWDVSYVDVALFVTMIEVIRLWSKSIGQGRPE